jgi:inhibitor of cysteine peptidase
MITGKRWGESGWGAPQRKGAALSFIEYYDLIEGIGNLKEDGSMVKKATMLRMLLVFVMSLSLLTGCFGSTQETEGDLPGDQNHIADADTGPSEKPEEDSQDEKFYLRSEKYGFYLEAPAHWRDKVEVSEEDHGFVVRHRTISKDAVVQNPVIINVVEYGTVEKWEQDSIKEDEPFPYDKVGVINGRVFASVFLFDFPYGPESPTDAEEFESLLSSRDEVLKSFTPIDNAGSSEAGSRYRAAGIDDPAGFEKYFREVQSLIVQGDRQEVVKHFRYPVELNIDNASVTINDEMELLDRYDAVFNNNVVNAVAGQKTEDLFVNAMGVMVGDGQVWFGVTDQGEYFILSVNP